MDAARTSTTQTPGDRTFSGLGVALNYRLQGKGSRSLVCIHGVGSNLEAWEDVAAKLDDTFRILTLDLRGHGRSSLVKGAIRSMISSGTCWFSPTMSASRSVA